MASNTHETYLEKKIEAEIAYNEQEIKFKFQRAKLKMSNLQEIQLIKVIDSEIDKETILVDDYLIITYKLPESYNYFHVIEEKNMRTKLQFAYNLVRKVKEHSLKRLNLCICPENIVFDQGLKPFFLHYGVKESLPPYQVDDEMMWLETKATVAAIVDQQHQFSTYLAHYETKELSELAHQVMTVESYESLLKLIKNQIRLVDKYEETIVHIPQRRWKGYRNLMIVLIVLLMPLGIYSTFALFFKIPEKNAYIDSSYYFQKKEYSSVIETLNKYKSESMPEIAQHQLALSYLVNESLTEAQRQNIENTLTLQTDRNYYLYWINVGRGNYQEAIDTARILEDRDLIIYALLKDREKIKADSTLTGQEREEEIKKIQQEIDAYQQDVDESEATEQSEKTDQEYGEDSLDDNEEEKDEVEEIDEIKEKKEKEVEKDSEEIE